MSKVRVDGSLLSLWCPACKMAHTIDLNSTRHYKWNGNQENPTVFPTINYRNEDYKCKSIVGHGQWHYLSDSTHLLAGQHMDVPDFPEEDGCQE